MVAVCPHGWAVGWCFVCLQEDAELPLEKAPGFLCDRETQLLDYIRVNRMNTFTNLDHSIGMSYEMAFTVVVVFGTPVRLCKSLVNLCETENFQKERQHKNSEQYLEIYSDKSKWAQG